MWDMLQSCEQNCNEQLIANNRFDTTYHLVNRIPEIYYENTTRQVVVDKCRSWTLPANQDLLRRFVTDTPKTIVLTRPIDEIVASFAALYEQNDKEFDESVLLREDSEPLMRSLRGVEWAKQVNKGEFFFITYKELVDDTDAVLDSVYGFIGIERFEHDLNNIVNVLPENDAVYGLIGMHDVRQTICSKEKVI